MSSCCNLKPSTVLVTVLLILAWITYFASKNQQEPDTPTHIIEKYSLHRHDEVFREESPDIFRSLPEAYLPDYKSFCWDDPASGRFNCLPGLYLAGMPKCGSTDLFTKLVWHQELRRPLVGDFNGKSSHWWTRKRVGRFGEFGVDSGEPASFNAYIDMLAPQGAMRGQHESVLVDGSQSPMWDLDGWEDRYPGLQTPPYTNADLIHAVAPKSKVLVILRNPTERLFSDFMFFNEQISPTEFGPMVEAEISRFERCVNEKGVSFCCYSSGNSNIIRLRNGMYITYLRAWWKKFEGRMKVVRLEEYSKDTVTVLMKIYQFVEVAPPDNQELETFVANSTIQNSRSEDSKKKWNMPLEVAERINKFYEPYNMELEQFFREHPDIILS